MRLSENIESIFAEDEAGTAVTVQTIIERVNVKGFGILLVLLALPSALPVPAPGYSVPFGLVLILLGSQIVRRKEVPWLPQRFLAKEVNFGKNTRLQRMMVRFLRLFEYFIRPRLSFIFSNALTYRILGIVVVLCGMSMCIPVPLTNTAPAFGVFLIGIGMIEEDGFFSGLGVLAGITGLLLSLTVLTFIIMFGMEGVDIIKDFIKSLLSSPDPESTVKVSCQLLLSNKVLFFL